MRRLLTAAVPAAVALSLVPTATANAEPPPVVAVVGDSYVAGWTATSHDQADAWWQTTARDLGWRPGSIVANPGAGFWTWGDYGTVYESLRDHPIAPDTDYVLLQAGLNDSGKDPARVVRSVADTIGLIHQQAPGAVVIVVGMLVPGKQGMTAARLDIARRLGDHEAIGDTRYMIAAMCTYDVSSDGTHPTVQGHRQIGDWVAWHIANGLDNGQPLHWNGDHYTV